MEETRVDQTTSAADELNRFFDTLHPLLCGTDAMRKASEKLLPKFPAEEPDAYKLRLESATLFPAYARTVAVLSARPFSEPVKVDEKSPKEFKDVWSKDVDNEGSSIDEFLTRLLAEALGYGFAGILVDAPVYKKGVTPLTRAQEKEQGKRPYLCAIKAKSILGWRFVQTPEGYRFSMLRFSEIVTEPNGEFGETNVEQIRVLESRRWRTYRKASAPSGTYKVGDWVLYKEGTTDLDYVPFVPVYGKYLGFMRSRPALLDLGFMNIEHWQSKSDQQTILHVARVPILTCIGGDDKTKITVGGASAVIVPLNGDLKYTEHTGQAIGAGQKSLDALELLMRQAGAELLVVRPGSVTATQVWTENEAGMSTLQRITLNLQASINLALKFLCEMAGVDPTAQVQIFTDFGVQSLETATADILIKMQGAGLLSKETLFNEMQRRGIVEGSLDWEAEQKKVTEEGGSLGNMNDDPNIDPLTGKPKQTGTPPPPGTP